MKKLLSTLFNHERYQTISILLAAGLLLWMTSCTPKLKSILEPGRVITQTELQGEVALIQSRIDSGLENIAQQEAVRTLLLSLAQAYTVAGTFNPMSALTGVLALVSAGGIIDNTRKRRIIKRLTT